MNTKISNLSSENFSKTFKQRMKEKYPDFYALLNGTVVFFYNVYKYPINLYKVILSRLKYETEKMTPHQLASGNCINLYMETDWRAKLVASRKTEKCIELIDFIEEARHADLIWDIGANYGEFTLGQFKKNLKPNVKIISVEPNPKMFKSLEASIRISNINDLCTPLKVALSEEDGTAIFNIDLFTSGSSTLLSEVSNKAQTFFGLRTLKIPTTLKRAETIAKELNLNLSGKLLMKIDVEEKDFDVLYSAKKLIDECSGYRIVLETAIDSASKAYIDYKDFLESLFQKSDTISAIYKNEHHLVKSWDEYLSHFAIANSHIDLMFTRNWK